MAKQKNRPEAKAPVGGIDEVMKRSVDGKVGVVERGGEPKVVGSTDKEDESKDNGADGGGNGAAKTEEGPRELASEKTEKKEAAEAPKAPDVPQPVPLDDDDAEQIREALQSMRDFEAQLASARIQYRQTEDDLIDKRKTAQTELNATVKSIAKRNKVPDGWMVNLDLMQFEPPRRQPFPFQRR